MSPMDLALLAGLDFKVNVQGPFSDPVVYTAVGIAIVVLLLLVFVAIWLLSMWRHSLPGLRKLPQTDEEKLHAVELTLKGAVICILGILFPLLVLIGVVPLYYGVRKLAAIRLGIGGTEQEKQAGVAQ
jgi:hypothetical protein